MQLIIYSVRLFDVFTGHTRRRLLKDQVGLADHVRMRFEPMIMVEDLATSVEMLSAAIEAIPTDRRDQSGGRERRGQQASKM